MSLGIIARRFTAGVHGIKIQSAFYNYNQNLLSSEMLNLHIWGIPTFATLHQKFHFITAKFQIRIWRHIISCRNNSLYYLEYIQQNRYTTKDYASFYLRINRLYFLTYSVQTKPTVHACALLVCRQHHTSFYNPRDDDDSNPSFVIISCV